MFVEFDCGCVGLRDVQGDAEGRPLIIVSCDGEDPSLAAYRRNMSDKTWTPLLDDLAAKIVDDLGRLLMDGHRFRQVMSLLTV